MRVLVTAASRHEATREIADAIGSTLRRHGIDVDAVSIEDVASIDLYDAVVIGSAVYMGRWLKSARKFVQANAVALAAVPVWLFSSGPLGPADHRVPEGEPSDVPELMRLTSARQHHVFAGRLDKKRLGLAERAAVHAVHASEADCRDWDEIEAFAHSIAAALTSATPPLVRGRISASHP